MRSAIHITHLGRHRVVILKNCKFMKQNFMFNLQNFQALHFFEFTVCLIWRLHGHLQKKKKCEIVADYYSANTVYPWFKIIKNTYTNRWISTRGHPFRRRFRTATRGWPKPYLTATFKRKKSWNCSRLFLCKYSKPLI